VSRMSRNNEEKEKKLEKIEEEALKPNIEQEKIEEKARTIKSRLATQAGADIDRVEEEISEQERRLSEIESQVPSTAGPLTLPTLIQKPEALEKIMKTITESDDPIRMTMALWMLSNLQMQMTMNTMMQLDLMDRMRERFRGKKEELTPETIRQMIREELGRLQAPRQEDELLKRIKALYRKIRKLEEKGGDSTLKEFKEALKELKEAVTAGYSPDRLVETVNKFMELAERLRGKVEKEEEKSELDKFIEYGEKVKKMLELFGVRQQAGTTTKAPLSYKGEAPWYFHPDARQAIKDIAGDLITKIGNILVKIYGRKSGMPVATEVKKEEKLELPEELRL